MERNLTRRFLVTLTLAGALLTGMGGVSSADDAADQPTLRTCGNAGFPLSVFSKPGGYQKEQTGLAAMLRHEFSIDRLFPRKGWRVVARGENWAELVAGKPKRNGNAWILFRKQKGKWRFESGWDSCWFEPYRTESSAGEWFVAKGQKATPETTSLKVDVFEMDCNSGKPPWGRIMKPEILYREDWIVVTYFVRHKPTPTWETCPTNPPLSKKLKLAEPLGDRTILDGGKFPYPRKYPSPKRSPWG